MASLAVQLGLTAGSALAGGLQNTRAARTSESSSSSSSSGSNTSRRRRVLTPGQTGLNDTLTSEALRRITNPAAVAEPLRAATREKINANFAGVPDLLRQKYGSTGYGSGKLGTAQRQAEISRLGALSDVDSDFNQLILQLQESGIGLGERLLSQNFEEEDYSSYTGSQSGRSVGTQPGSVAAGAFGNASSTLSALLALNQVLKGGGGGGGGNLGFLTNLLHGGGF